TDSESQGVVPDAPPASPGFPAMGSMTPTGSEPEVGTDADGAAGAVKRRLDDHAAHIRRVGVHVHELAQSISALVEHQRRKIRWLNLNSFGAYVVFTLLCGGAFYFLYQSRARELVADRDRAIAERDKATADLDAQTARTVARASADVKALAAWQLL